MAKMKNVTKFSQELQVQQVMKKLDLMSCQDKIASNLNSEQRKRLSIAIALLNDPQVVIMDEPTSGIFLREG